MVAGWLFAACVLLVPVAPAAAASPSPTGSSSSKVEQRLDAARTALWRWELDEAARSLRRKVAGAAEVERQTLLGRLDLQRSEFAAVDKRLTPLVAAHPDAWEARVVLGTALQSLGQKTRAFTTLDAIADAYQDDRLKTPADLVSLGVSLQLTDYVKNANQIFEEALEADPKLIEASVLWAELFVHKYNFRDSDQLLVGALRQRHFDLRALTARALIDIASDRAYDKARTKVEAVLDASPQFVPAHNLLARIELENERPEAAIERLESHSLKIAPRDLDALALLGAAYQLADDTAGFAQVERRALKVNPRFARFYTTVSEHASRMHRYKEAAAFDERALVLDSEHWPAYVNLGTGWSRLGDDDKAVHYLELAFDGDPYDVRTFNLLDSFYDGEVKRFEWVTAGPMRVRLHRDERAILERYVPPLLEEAWAHLTRKYGMTPELPVHVEIFPKTETFAVRSIGLPQLAAHGICFGHVVTARSPAPGNFNWAEVLWHELSHVFHIQLSNSRVPRWFTEGLAVYEATEGRPSWRREMDGTLLAYREAGKLRGVAEFNLSFTRARSMSDILVAYFHAYRMAEFIDGTWGTAKMKEMLILWGDKKKTPAVFREALGVRDLAQFDERFLTWLDGEVAYLKRGFRLDEAMLAPDADALTEKADAAPKDVDAQVRAAIAWLGRKDADQARKYADAALKSSPDEHRARMVRALVKLGKDDDAAGALTDLEVVLAAGKDGRDVREWMARAARKSGRPPAEAIEHLERALAFDPKAGELYHALIDMLDTAGRGADAHAWRRKALLVDQAHIGLVDALLTGAEAHKATAADVAAWGEHGNHVAPFSLDHHLRFARELARLGDKKRARFEAESALAIDPDSEEARALLAR